MRLSLRQRRSVALDLRDIRRALRREKCGKALTFLPRLSGAISRSSFAILEQRVRACFRRTRGYA